MCNSTFIYAQNVKIFAKSIAHVIKQIFIGMDTIKLCAVFRTAEVEMAIKCDVANYHWNQPIAIKVKDMYENRKKQSHDGHNQLIETKQQKNSCKKLG